MVKGESIVGVGAMEARRKEDNGHQDGANTASIPQASTSKNEDQVNLTCLLYIGLLKGGSTLKLP